MSAGDPQSDQGLLPGLDIEVERVIDKHSPTRPGDVGYHYDYVLYHFRLEDRQLQARSYADTAEQASLTSLIVRGVRQPLVESELGTELVEAALDYLRAHGKRRLCWFDLAGGCYRELPSERELPAGE